MTAELEAKKQINARIHRLRVRLGKARAEAKRAETLTEKVTRYSHVKELQRELTSFQKRYWEEVARLEDAA